MVSDRLLNERLDQVDYYTLLGVARDATADRIRDAFHRFALKYHPDQHVGDSAGSERALRVFKRGSEGYRVLLDPVLRARYDAAMGRGEARLTPEAERKSVVSESRAAVVPMPVDIAPFYDKAREAFDKGDLKNAKAFLTLAARKSNHAKIQELTREILEAEKNLFRRK